MVTSGKADKIW